MEYDILDREAMWERPKTIKRYLQPPKSERLFVLWREGKLVFGEIRTSVNFNGYHKVMADGLWLVHGENDEQFDYTKVEPFQPEDGTPIHGLRFIEDGAVTNLEAFCDTLRKTTCFISVKVENPSEKVLYVKQAFLLRYGEERKLAYGTPDNYCHYDPKVSEWKPMEVTYHPVKKPGIPLAVMDENSFVTASDGDTVVWDEQKGALRWELRLQPGETRTLYFSFGSGEILPFDYGEEKRKTMAFWHRELARLDKLPADLRKNGEHLRILQNLTVQMLQCISVPVGEDYLLSRQGGQWRLLWQWETVPMLEALGLMGSFEDYIEPIIALNFDRLQKPDGDIGAIGAKWASLSASVLMAFSRYCLCCGKRFWYRYRDNAIAAFEWIRRTRMSTYGKSAVIEGLFPPMQANDWANVFQNIMTNVTNIEGMDAFAAAAEHFGDQRAAEIRQECSDYRKAVLAHYEPIFAAQNGKDTLFIPLHPSGDDTELIKSGYPRNHGGRLIRAGIVPLSEAHRVYRALEAEGKCYDGLHGHMPRPNGNDHIWYASTPDFDWFVVRLALGEREEAEKILQAQLKWVMTDEYYMLERYADNDPYYVPWSPNASASGRLCLMILQLYGIDTDRGFAGTVQE